MALRFRKNQYQGINAHLHSRLQNEFDAWDIFHTAYITDLARAIDALLPPGYIAEPEKGLQIKQFHPLTGETIKPELLRKSKPDISIYETSVSPRAGTYMAGVAAAPTLELPTNMEVEEPEIYLSAVVIRVIEDDEIKKPVTWLEVLSPTNKPGKTGFSQYYEKRHAALKASIALVEIDYLHETPPVTSLVPSYPDHESGAFPYGIIVTNPRPTLHEGRLRFYGIAINTPIPTIKIPLSGDDTFILDFNQVYQQTYESLAAYSQRVDYDREPERFDTYHPADQERIRSVMTAAHTDSIDAEKH